MIRSACLALLLLAATASAATAQRFEAASDLVGALRTQIRQCWAPEPGDLHAIATSERM
jgi:hypothetical protein